MWHLLGFLVLACVPGAAGAAEEQTHGIVFEREVRLRITGDAASNGYTAEWDIPGDLNRLHPGLPVSVKCIAWGNAVYLGDAVRQRRIDHPFAMVVGFYREEEENARLVALHYVIVEPVRWRQWWGEVALDELLALAGAIKGPPLAEAQALGRAKAGELRARSGIIGIHPKINADQRRIQCAISFKDFYAHVIGSQPEEGQDLLLAGKPFTPLLPKGYRLQQ